MLYWSQTILANALGPNQALYGNPDETSVTAEFSIMTYSMRLEVFHEQIYVGLGPDRNHLIDAPYDMFCMPFDDDIEIVDALNNVYKGNKLAAMAIATAIGATLGQGNIYDIQLLPYCPVRDYVKEDGTIDIGAAPVNIIKDENDAPLFPIMWATQSKFSFEVEPETEDLIVPSDPVAYKVDNETKVYRLSDGSQSSFFEFSVAKNGGSVVTWDIDCNYKPYSPYIHVAPKFWGLYGKDFNDIRGLICGGEFSLTQITSAWADYQMNNKNYQLMFDREIKSLDIQQDVARQKDILNLAMGSIGGAVAGGVAKGAGGAITGLGAGLIKSTTAAIWNEQLRQETMAYKIDMFGYNLGNIKAIPYGIAKISAFTQNNKIFPFLEIYEATDEEVDAFKNKLKYNGMTVMVIGTISDYINPRGRTYVKGRFIRLEGLDAEYHEASELAEEFEKGVYIGDDDGDNN